MKKIPLKSFFTVFSIFVIVTSILYSLYIYNFDKQRVLAYEEEHFSLDCKEMNYHMARLVAQKNFEALHEYILVKTSFDKSYNSLSLFDGNEIVFSSNEEYLNKTLSYFKPIYLEELFSRHNFENQKFVIFDIDMINASGKDKSYSLVIELNRGYVWEYLKQALYYNVYYVLIFSLVMSTMLIYFSHKFLIQPIKTINQKIESQKFVYSDFLISDINDIDISLVESANEHFSNLILLDSLVNSLDDLIFYKDKEFRYVGCNDAFLEFVGQTKEKLIGHDDFELFDFETASLFRQMDVKTLKENELSSNFEWITYPDGAKVYLQTKKVPFLYDGQNYGILGISRDLTKLHLAQKQLKRQTYIDTLTSLGNRKAYNEKVEELLSLHRRYKTPFSILMYDIDDFKNVNDTYGHAIGDEVLIQMSQLIRSLIRENDYIFRIGGEEFVVLFSHTGLKEAKVVAEKVLKAVPKMDVIKNQVITISIGLTEAIAGDSEDTIFQRVDALLYKSKKNGKNQINV